MFCKSGFKCVYKAVVQGRMEAWKFLAMKEIDEPNVDSKLRGFSKEQFAELDEKLKRLPNASHQKLWIREISSWNSKLMK